MGDRETSPFIIPLCLRYLRACSRREPEEGEDAGSGRDVFNEKPPADELMALTDVVRTAASSLPDSAVRKKERKKERKKGACHQLHLPPYLWIIPFRIWFHSI